MRAARRFVLARYAVSIGALCFVLALLARPTGEQPAATAPLRPFPQHVEYVSGTILPTHRTRAELDADVVAAWERWKTRHLASAGTESDGRPRYRVRAIDPGGTTVSEAQGYGMLLSAYLAGADPDARVIFDGLFEFSADHPSDGDPKLFDWSVPPSEAAGADDDSAFDGDADIAYALLLADQQWGSAGKIDYRARAFEGIAAILRSEIGPASRLPLLGDWVDPHGLGHNQWTPRPSDFMTGHFRVFGAATGEPAWAEVRLAALAAARSLRERFAAATGLLPDFSEPTSALDPALRPARPSFLESPYDGDYYYNAGRVPWRLGLDALHSGDATAWAGALAIAFWAKAKTQGDPAQLREGYTLAGVEIDPSSAFDPLFAAPIGVAAMLDVELQTWLEALYDAVRESDHGYYADTVSLLSMLVMTGNWWEPLPVPEPSALASVSGVLAALAILRRVLGASRAPAQPARSGSGQTAPSL